ncbi:protein GRAVITROPIC IN THE LIGHT 1 [Ricinus communis]|uniref:protein GRAVITROPIC IN THE LIGHT 1 n=1 Tax=Ricinus communis TaxID=3988 RepID=UPI00201A8A3C|nr:protein GRAVITROPIC IN THE LIGHT 1 [Ricinus communis]XP_048235330.1 protein GRAVITROPIC IN THE LIGHT 1 [Ricinus communis]
MDSVKLSAMTPKKSKFARAVAKVLHLRAATGVAPVDGVQKVKSQERVKDDKFCTKDTVNWAQSFKFSEDEELQKSLATEALLAKLFASVSSIKAAYAQLQCAQSPYDVDGIQAADQLVVSELKNLSELKQCYIKKQFDPSPDTTMVLAELQEQKSVSKTYEIMGNKLESQLRLKDSEIMYLREKLEESSRHNQLLDKRLNRSGQLSVLDNLHQSRLSPSHFTAVVRFTVKSIQSFVKLMIDQMKAADWDLDAAANSIVPDVVYWRADDKCFAFESFVCREIFDGFHLPNFSLPSESSLLERKNQNQLFFKRFTELRSVKAKDYLAQKPKSTFAKFCRSKYLQLVHPQMETSFFGNLSQRSLVNSGGFPDTTFFTSFSELAKRVWILHCLAFSFEPEASIFQVSKGCRFSEVYMECVAEDALLSSGNAQEADPPVAFTVFPGFRIGKTIIQCQVYLSPTKSKVNVNH